MKEDTILKNLTGRVVGFDAHPDTFTAAVVKGKSPGEALLEKTFDKLPNSGLESWAKKNLTKEDIVVMEASGNSFHLARRLKAIDLRAIVLESYQVSKLKDAYANNDKVSAKRIALAYLSGSSKQVWIPDEITQRRRDQWHAYRKSNVSYVRAVNRADSYLSDNGVRLSKSLTDLSREQAQKLIEEAREWTAHQKVIVRTYLNDIQRAREQRADWLELMTSDVVKDPLLLSVLRLCGARTIVAFGCGAIIGDIHRFETPKRLAKFIGLSPSFDSSGKDEQVWGLSGRGREDFRSVLVEAAHSILQSKSSPIGRWGKKLLIKGKPMKVVIVAIARKLAVAIWYLMKGQWEELSEVEKPLAVKIGKVITQLGQNGLQTLGKDRKSMRKEMVETLKTGRVYVLKPVISKPPAPLPKVQITSETKLSDLKALFQQAKHIHLYNKLGQAKRTQDEINAKKRRKKSSKK